MGLAITRKLVLLLEGDIKIESEQGKGSRFHVYLPLPEGPSHPDENPSGPEAEHTPASPDSTGIRQIDTPRKDSEPIHLILIDDDRIQLQLTTAMLERPGVTVTCCHHPEELLNKLKDKCFDALLTDIQMPAMNGFDLLKAIRTLDTSWVCLALVILCVQDGVLDALSLQNLAQFLGLFDGNRADQNRLTLCVALLNAGNGRHDLAAFVLVNRIRIVLTGNRLVGRDLDGALR